MPIVEQLRHRFAGIAEVKTIELEELNKIPKLRDSLQVSSVPALFLTDWESDTCEKYQGPRDFASISKTLTNWI